MERKKRTQISQLNKIEKHINVEWSITLNSNSEEIKWIPIFCLDFDHDYKRTFGLTSDGKWTNLSPRLHRQTITVVHDQKEYLKIITALQKERPEIEEKLLEGLKKNTNGSYNVHIFPFLDLIKYALKGDSNYWAKRAVSWLRQEEFDHELSLIAKKIITEKKLDQSARHQLFRLMKRFENS